DVNLRSAVGESLRNRLPETMRGASHDRHAVVEIDIHVSAGAVGMTFANSSRLESASGLLPSSICGAGTPSFRPISTTGKICASTSVLRLRIARSRQMPECDLVERRLCFTISSKDWSRHCGVDPGAKAAGSKPSNASGL